MNAEVNTDRLVADLKRVVGDSENILAESAGVVGDKCQDMRERLAETLEACATPKSAADIIPVMFKRELDAHQTVFALGETLAHLHYLRDEGKVAATVGTDGIVRFKRS